MKTEFEDNVPVVWSPQPGSQTQFLSCPIFEVLFEGTRGPGKTDALIMSYAMHVGQGYGQDWRGIMFRRTYGQLADVVAKTKKWLPIIFPTAKFNESSMVWTFEDGEQLLLRYMDREADYWNYHGHEYPWIGWEELTNWPSDDCYEIMKSCCRSSNPNVPRMYRSTCNPFGVGHNWVKAYFISPAKSGIPIRNPEGQLRVRIHGTIYENKILLDADPEYLMRLKSLSDPVKKEAWLKGSWDIVAGGIFSDLWRENIHVIPQFIVPPSWEVMRTYDDGDSAPFSVGWWAITDGSEIKLSDGRTFCPPPKSFIRLDEWYGWNGRPNRGCRLLPGEIAAGVQSRDKELRKTVCPNSYVAPGPADNAIFDAAREKSVADQMAAAPYGVRWARSDKRPGSRIAGAKLFRTMLKETMKEKPLGPCFYVVDVCRQFLRTVPVLPRDPRKKDDVDTSVEDHIWDETRYAILQEDIVAQTVALSGA